MSEQSLISEQEQQEINKRLTVDASVKSHASEARKENNQDATFVLQFAEHAIWIAGVFDGVGGHLDGARASGLAKESIKKAFQDAIASGIPPTEELLRAYVAASIKAADKKVHEEANGNGMAATSDIVVLFSAPSGERRAIVGHLGDSRVYLWRDGELVLYTIDDNNLALSGTKKEIRERQRRFDNITHGSQLSAEEIALFKQRNEISKAIGFGNMSPEVFVLSLKPGDKIFMCSDGISDNLTLDELTAQFKKYDSANLTSARIMNAAIMRSHETDHFRAKPDDITCIVIDPFMN